jgi:hypothetical protein
MELVRVRRQGGRVRQWGVRCDVIARASMAQDVRTVGGGNGTTTSIIVDDHRRLGEGIVAMGE